MAINFESALGIHEQALQVRARRTKILSNNLANADTPGFLARDIDFSEVLNGLDKKNNQGAGRGTINLAATQSGHINTNVLISDNEIKYRIPLSNSADGNTVESTTEYMNFTENALRFQAGLQFLSGRFSGLIDAIKGGE